MKIKRLAPILVAAILVAAHVAFDAHDDVEHVKAPLLLSAALPMMQICTNAKNDYLSGLDSNNDVALAKAQHELEICSQLGSGVASIEETLSR
jgi:hypothetical protein